MAGPGGGVMAGTLVSLLADFSPPMKSDPLGLAVLRSTKAVPAPELEPPKLTVNVQAEMRSLEARVRAEEQEVSRLRLEEAVAAEKTRYEQEISAQREIWVEQQAMQLSNQMVETIDRIEALVVERVSNILKPFVSEAYKQQSLDELRDVLANLLHGGVSKLIKITGPEDLLASLRAKLGSHESAIEFRPGEHVEVCLIAEDTTIQTQLDTWSSRLKLA
jgi:hypothetical protein